MINNRSERIRANRDFVTKSLEPVRGDIVAAVEAGLAYFPLAAGERTPVLEATVLARERAVRRSMTGILERADSVFGRRRDTIEREFDAFIAELTGGNFGSKDAVADMASATRVADAGAKLGAVLTSARTEFLAEEVSRHPLSLVAPAWAGLRRAIGRD